MKNRKIGIPTKGQLEEELKREKKKVRRRSMVFGTIEALVVAAAVTALVSVFLAPVLRIDGNSMEPTLHEDEIVITLRERKYERGDLIAFHHNNKILVKRIVALEGETVDIDEKGIVYINEVPMEEDYLKDAKTAFGKCNITLPCEVPEGSVFVMGDNREVSVDSRSVDIGCISGEQVISRAAFRIWPFESFGTLK